MRRCQESKFLTKGGNVYSDDFADFKTFCEKWRRLNNLSIIPQDDGYGRTIKKSGNFSFKVILFPRMDDWSQNREWSQAPSTLRLPPYYHRWQSDALSREMDTNLVFLPVSNSISSRLNSLIPWWLCNGFLPVRLSGILDRKNFIVFVSDRYEVIIPLFLPISRAPPLIVFWHFPLQFDSLWLHKF